MQVILMALTVKSYKINVSLSFPGQESPICPGFFYVYTWFFITINFRSFGSLVLFGSCLLVFKIYALLR